jgi:hypothetical protein
MLEVVIAAFAHRVQDDVHFEFTPTLLLNLEWRVLEDYESRPVLALEWPTKSFIVPLDIAQYTLLGTVLERRM